MDTQLYLVGLWTEIPLNYTLKSIIYKEYTVVEIPATFLTDSTRCRIKENSTLLEQMVHCRTFRGSLASLPGEP